MKPTDTKTRYAGYVYILVAFLCLTPWVTPPVALFAGLVFAFFLGSPFPLFNRRASRYLLQVSVVGLGFGMNLNESLRAGADGIVFTIFSVVGVMAVGILIGRLFHVDRKTAYLISSGTAICGGSAIAATGPIAKADEAQMSVSLATIFVLNAVALFLFPPLGHLLGLTEQQFGTWAAIAIHDTSSVVGAGAAYGDEALRIATTVKLTRALWIIPLSLYTAFHFHARNERISIPWFILCFILAMTANTYLRIPAEVSSAIVRVARQSLTLTLFFIGAGLSRATLRTISRCRSVNEYSPLTSHTPRRTQAANASSMARLAWLSISEPLSSCTCICSEKPSLPTTWLPTICRKRSI